MKKQKQCEHCGAKGELRKDLPWAKILCDDCYEKSDKKYSPNR